MQMVKELQRYIKQTLGVDADTSGWDEGKGLPFFLREAYDVSLLRLMGRNYLLMMDRQKDETPPATVRKHMEQLRKTWPDEIIYVREQVTGYNRNRLIQNQVPFVVPGNQLYLPMLAMDLRERFVAKRAEVKKLSPAAQVVVLHAIYAHRVLFDEGVTQTDWAKELGYTKMTMTRAFRDLRAIFAEDEPGVEALRGKALWDRLRPFLRNPIRKRRFYAIHQPDQRTLAGDSALAFYTMMAEPDRRTICMDTALWRTFQEQLVPIELERAEPECLEVQIWNYSPALFARNGVADPLSVWLSYEKNTDERVEMALEKTMEDVQW